jgi:aspartyl-tRNA(Asn)/glutamyl-tRNA(Gln) amidotransferase subunit C
MSIDIKEVLHIERLARLTIADEDKKTFVAQLSNILEYINKLNEIDTSDIEPTSHVIGLANVMREDAPRPSLKTEEALGNAPEEADNFNRVPKIIE